MRKWLRYTRSKQNRNKSSSYNNYDCSKCKKKMVTNSTKPTLSILSESFCLTIHSWLLEFYVRFLRPLYQYKMCINIMIEACINYWTDRILYVSRKKQNIEKVRQFLAFAREIDVVISHWDDQYLSKIICIFCWLL